MFEVVNTQKAQSTSAFGFAVWQEVDDATLTDDEASDYEDPLSTDLVQDEGYIEGEDVDMLDCGGQDADAVPAEDEQCKSINLLTQRAKDSLIENSTIDQRAEFAATINPEVVVKMDI